MVAICPSRARPSPNDVRRTNGRRRMIGSTEIGRDKFIARWMVRASVAPSPKPSAKAPPQEPCPGSKAAKARGRQLARRRLRRRFVGGVARSGGAVSRERGNDRFLPLAHG